MNLPCAIEPADLAGFWLALGAYGAFLVLAVATRAGSGTQPQSRFHRLHLRTSLLYVAAFWAWLAHQAAGFEWHSISDFFIGLFVYFGIHYAIGSPFFVLAQASVSTSLLSIIAARGGRATEEQCRADYGGGKGFSFIREQRLSRLQGMLGWVNTSAGKIRLTRRGRVAASLTALLLKLWGLRQIGGTE